MFHILHGKQYNIITKIVVQNTLYLSLHIISIIIIVIQFITRLCVELIITTSYLNVFLFCALIERKTSILWAF